MEQMQAKFFVKLKRYDKEYTGRRMEQHKWNTKNGFKIIQRLEMVIHN
jgi:hypothetical protein